ncbi:hypothetical protein AVEN_275228-1 [Araneus ventricosus]|uniref:Uncharacterized protein n=1 Tax=Araneus ventricosus TaxID=182803 RepID=A0A4Y2UME7_ARAVE|nr:hypothetical protein AVEN_275228-1 [Araneus ventricosus]
MKPRCIKCNGEHAERDCNIKEKIEEPTRINCGEKDHLAAWKGCKALPVLMKTAERRPRRSYAQAVAADRKNEKRTEGKAKETETSKDMDITELKESQQTLREVQTLIQDFPTLLETAKLCHNAKTKQEKFLSCSTH